ncbi:MAG: hypothetical protein CVU90_09020 [Firmicutes bacterium HGW-Firmicutes-15]|nr:MAG: hypothetical protein CVU90_09020 [Firmicutes bacterium HGW-Firmicutes-15]
MFKRTDSKHSLYYIITITAVLLLFLVIAATLMRNAILVSLLIYLWKNVKIAIAIMGVVLTLIMLWNLSLQKQLRKHVRALASELEERRLAQEEIEKHKDIFQNAYQDLQSSYEEVESLAGELEKSQHNLMNINAELSSSQERLKLALWGARADMWDWYVSTGELVYNNRNINKAGNQRIEIKGHISEWENRIHFEDWPLVYEAISSHMKKETSSYSAEYRIRNMRGEWVWVMDSGKVVSWDSEGKALRVIGITQVITARKKAEQLFANSVSIYQTIFEATNNAILIVEANEFGVLEANSAACRETGYSLEELKQSTLSEMSARNSNEAQLALQQQMAIVFRDGTAVMHTEVRYKNGSVVPVLIRFNIMPGTESNRVMAVVIDISEKIKFQEERKKRLQYEEQAIKMTTLSVMSAGVVHEISQPLNAIKILADGMLFWYETVGEIDSGEIRTAVQHISTQAERINDIIMHMRDLANAAEEGEFYPCDLNKAVCGAIKLLQQELIGNDIRVELELEDKLCMVRGIALRLEEIVANLLINAMHALNERYQSPKLIICRTRQEGEQVILEISDNGPGIGEEVLKHIWEPFFTTKKGGQGMGLGLAIVNSIVSKIGGNIVCYNNDGDGATFRLELPVMIGE